MSFSPLQVGKEWFYDEIRKRWGLFTLQGHETAHLRGTLGLQKSSKKLAETFSAHCVDSWVLAYHAIGGDEVVDNTEIFCIAPITYHRRNLFKQNPVKAVNLSE